MSRGARLGLFLALAIGVIGLDQWMKLWTRTNLHIAESWPGGPLPGIFEFTLSYNRGVAFGAFQGFALFATPIAVAIAVTCGLSAWRGGGPLKSVALGLMAAGALGNLIDRLFNPRGVTDMFLVRLSNLTGGRMNDFPVFNVADTSITFAVILLAIVWLREDAAKGRVVAAKTEGSTTIEGPSAT